MLPTMETIVALCKRKGFVFQSAEIYGGNPGFFDYGPLGVLMRKNIKDAWWKDMVQKREDMVGLDSAGILPAPVWAASGHLGGFNDPMVDCKESKKRFRADQLFYGQAIVDGETIGYVSVLESDTMQEEADAMAEKLKRKLSKQGTLEPVALKEYADADPSEYDLVPSPETGNIGTLTAPRDFNLMFSTHVGPIHDDTNIAYLRPETAQGIFINFKNVTDTARVKVPFGIGQIGRAYRNEITPRNFIFRSREFEQMEIEYFIEPDEDTWKAHFDKWLNTRVEWHKSIGLRPELLSLQVHAKDKLAHYAKACTDIVFKYPFGTQELEGVAARGNFDLTQHHEASGKNLEYFDEARKERYLPHVIEPSLGVDRLFLALLCSAYCEDEIDGEKRTVLKLHPRIAPVKVAILPLVRNKPEIVELARSLFEKLSDRWEVTYDSSGAVGRRYRRGDEIGIPYAVTVDFDSLEDQCVTVRDRDSTKQERIAIAELENYLAERLRC